MPVRRAVPPAEFDCAPRVLCPDDLPRTTASIASAFAPPPKRGPCRQFNVPRSPSLFFSIIALPTAAEVERKSVVLQDDTDDLTAALNKRTEMDLDSPTSSTSLSPNTRPRLSSNRKITACGSKPNHEDEAAR